MTKIEYFIGMIFLQKLSRKLGLHKLMKHIGNISFVVNVYVEVNSEYCKKNFKSSFFLQSGCFSQTFKDTNLYHLSLLLTFKAYMKNYGIEKHFPAQSAKCCGKT